MGATACALIGFGGWMGLLTLVMGVYRSVLVLGGKRAVNSFAVDGSDLDALGHRITRARDNCYEMLPMFAVLALGAQISGHLDITDPLAMWVLYTRIGQSITHIVSTSVPAVWIRANLFFAQLLIYLWWAYRLMSA